MRKFILLMIKKRDDVKKVNIFICSFTGVIFIVIGLIFFESKLLVILAGVLFSVLLYPCLAYSDYRTNKKYEYADRIIPCSVIFKAAGNFSDAGAVITKCDNYTEKFVYHGLFYVCEDRLYFIVFDRKGMKTAKLLKNDIVSVEMWNNDICGILININGEPMCIFRSSQAEQLAEILKENDWFIAC